MRDALYELENLKEEQDLEMREVKLEHKKKQEELEKTTMHNLRISEKVKAYQTEILELAARC